MTTEGERGWLLCFDIGSKKSWLYRPPWIIELRMEEFQSTPSIKLTSKIQPDGNIYVFEGAVGISEVNGSLVVRSNSSASDVQNYAVYGYRLNPPARNVVRFPSGRYSNLRYMEETGDPVGVELLLFLTKGQNAGLIKFNESFWGEPEFIPLVLSNIRIVSDRKLEFDLKLKDGAIGKYTAIRKKDAIVLRRTDVRSTADTEGLKLLKRRSLLP